MTRALEFPTVVRYAFFISNCINIMGIWYSFHSNNSIGLQIDKRSINSQTPRSSALSLHPSLVSCHLDYSIFFSGRRTRNQSLSRASNQQCYNSISSYFAYDKLPTFREKMLWILFTSPFLCLTFENKVNFGTKEERIEGGVTRVKKYQPRNKTLCEISKHQMLKNQNPFFLINPL